MPPLEDMDRPHDAVLWERGGTDDYGNPTLIDPVPLKVFWHGKRTQTVNARGEPLALDATVVVDVVIPIGSKMWKGKLEDWDDSLKGELMEVVWQSDNTDIRDRWTRYKVGLTRYGDDLPVPPA